MNSRIWLYLLPIFTTSLSIGHTKGFAPPQPGLNSSVVTDALVEAKHRLKLHSTCERLFSKYVPAVKFIDMHIQKGGLMIYTHFPKYLNQAEVELPIKDFSILEWTRFKSPNVGAITTSGLVVMMPDPIEKNISVAQPVIVLNENGFIFTGRNDSGDSILEINKNGFDGLNSFNHVNAVAILHEYLHVFDLIPRDGNDIQQSISNTQLVREACFPESSRHAGVKE